jgi:hypothetical protein
MRGFVLVGGMGYVGQTLVIAVVVV